MDNNRVLSHAPKPRDTNVSVGEHSSRAEAGGASRGGAAGKADVGISNDKGSENLPRRKTKGSRATSIGPG